MSFQTLGLAPGLLSALSKTGYLEPTAIQKQAIPAILSGRDVLGGAQTGTGKTAAFALPVLQLLNERRPPHRHPRALVLTPTRELAAQVHESFSTYGRDLRMQTSVVYGGVNINPQIQRLRSGVDILVACPGRLLDHVRQRTVDLSAVEILILDEADRMLDMGFIHDIRQIIRCLPTARQNLMFSATYSPEIRTLAEGVLQDPETIEVSPRNTAAEKVSQVAFPVSREDRAKLLAHLISVEKWERVLVFARMKHGANRLAGFLEKAGIRASAIHGNKSQSARTRALESFRNGTVQVLVATDIAARGLDIPLLPCVVNFELPHVAEDYIHRIGRTARAGKSGQAVSLITRDEQPLFSAIERLLQKEIKVQELPDFNAGFVLQHYSPRDRKRPVQSSPRSLASATRQRTDCRQSTAAASPERRRSFRHRNPEMP